jgi:hypothetical protein
MDEYKKVFSDKSVINFEIGILLSLCHHNTKICKGIDEGIVTEKYIYCNSLIVEGVAYVEEMLRKQIVSALSKEVGTQDFTQYMIFHNRRMFKSQFQPTGFSFAIRVPDHFPEGSFLN